MRLSEDFFNRDTVKVARDLLGKFLVRRIGNKTISAMITETEAYCGPEDLASHASKGLIHRTKVMFGLAGYTYVYLIYGIYHCLNFVTVSAGYPAAVLIRSINLSRGGGPGKLCQTMKIDRTLNGLMAGNKKLWVEDRKVQVSPVDIKIGKRIGVDYAEPYNPPPIIFYYLPLIH